MPASRSAPSRSARTRARLKALPWAALARIAMAAGQRWQSLSQKDRARLAQLLRSSRGRSGNLSDRQRQELRKLVRKLDLGGMGRELAPLVRAQRRRRK